MAEYIERGMLIDRIRGLGYADQIKDNLLFLAATLPSDEHCAELIKADQKGRLVVLPCKVGDKLFQLFHGYIEPITVMRVRPYIMTDLVSFFPEDFGKTVFLTREDAEKALKGVSEDANN